MRSLVLVAITGCGFSKFADVAIDAPDSDGMTDAAIDAVPIDGAPGSARKKRITIPDAKVFGNLTNFPVWLVIDDVTDLGARATAAGDDIYFTRIDGTPLEWQRVAWSKASGHLEAWVKVDLTDGGPSEFDLRYGDPGPAHAPNAPMVWTNSFVAVWHMDDLLANTTIADARGAVMGTAVGGPVSIMNGKLGRAIDFDGSNDEVTFSNPITGGGSTTFSAWVSFGQPTVGYSTVLCIGNPASNASRFFHTKYSGLGVGFYNNDRQTSIDVNTSQFTLLHWVYNSATQVSTMYRNGVVVDTSTFTGTINTTGTGGHIGAATTQWGPGGNHVNGLLDEVRIANTARPLAWIQTEHANQADVGSFFSLGPEQQAP